MCFVSAFTSMSFISTLCWKTVNWFLKPNIWSNYCTEEVQSAVSLLYFYLFPPSKRIQPLRGAMLTTKNVCTCARIILNYRIQTHHSSVSGKMMRKLTQEAAKASWENQILSLVRHVLTVSLLTGVELLITRTKSSKNPCVHLLWPLSHLRQHAER